VKGRGVSPSRTLVITLATLPFLYPFVFLLGTALKSANEFQTNEAGLPHALTLTGIREAWTDASLGSAMLHSLVAVGIAVFVTVLVSASGAFWFLRHEGRLAKLLRIGLIGTMAIPLPAFIIPLFVLLADHGLTDNLIVMGLVYAGWNSSFGLYLTYAYFKGLPPEVLEAAQIDGATVVQQLRYVVMPLSKPVLVTLGVFAFIWSWSDLLAAVILVQDPAQRLLVPATALLADAHQNNVPRTASGVVIAMIPMVIVFLLGQRALVRGITSGVGK
jgi:raffinose/stachyose/melibiose transport system permease protein